MRSTTIVLTIVLCLSGAAQAAALNVWLEMNTNTTWSLWANIVGNEGGLASYSFDLVGPTTVTCLAPKAAVYYDEPPYVGLIGFTGGATSWLTAPSGGAGGTVQCFGYQNTSDASSIIYGVGVTAQTITSWPGADFIMPTSVAVGLPVELYRGTCPAGVPVAFDGTMMGAYAFEAVGNTNVTYAGPFMESSNLTSYAAPVASASYDPATGQVRLSLQNAQQQWSSQLSSPWWRDVLLDFAEVSSASNLLGAVDGVPWAGAVDARPGSVRCDLPAEMDDGLIFTAPASIAAEDFDLVLTYVYAGYRVGATPCGWETYRQTEQIPVTYLPEPTTLALLAMAGLALRRRR